MFWRTSFLTDDDIKKYENNVSLGGNWSVGFNSFMSEDISGDWGRGIILYLFGNEKESNMAYKAIREAEIRQLEREIENNKKNREISNINHGRDNKEKGFVYILKSRNLYKIGRAQYIKSRIKTYRTENPFGIRVIFQKEVDDYIKVEASLLDTFKDKKVRGEWFKLDKEDIKWIKQNT